MTAKYELHPDVKRLTQEHSAFTGESNITVMLGGWIYILHLGGDFYKIGSTRNISKRIRGFQTSNPFIAGEESIVAAIPIHEKNALDYLGRPKRYGHRVLEHRLHKFCRKQLWELDGYKDGINHKHNSSEIFRMAPENLETLLDYIVTLRGYKYLRGTIGTALSRINVRPTLEWENRGKGDNRSYVDRYLDKPIPLTTRTGLLERNFAEGHKKEGEKSEESND